MSWGIGAGTMVAVSSSHAAGDVDSWLDQNIEAMKQ